MSSAMLVAVRTELEWTGAQSQDTVAAVLGLSESEDHARDIVLSREQGGPGRRIELVKGGFSSVRLDQTLNDLLLQSFEVGVVIVRKTLRRAQKGIVGTEEDKTKYLLLHW